MEDLPASRLKGRLQELPPAARENAIATLRRIQIPRADLETIEVDDLGGLFYADEFELPADPPAQEETDPLFQVASAVPVSPFPASLKFHSRPGAPNVLYLNFAGEVVRSSYWNTKIGRTTIDAVAFSIDNDYSRYSPEEQTVIRKVWQRVAEDYAPFDIDVTTERPATLGSRVAHALITRSTDASGQANPSPTAGGVAYVGSFGTTSYPSQRPVWIYANNLFGDDSFIGEVASHEVGHNMGLTHDGSSGGTYYPGHGSGFTSWGTIMGTAYDRNVSQWSKGDYFQANNNQDDIGILASNLGYRSDDHGNTRAAATPLTINADRSIVVTTPDQDPSNLSRANKGVIERSSDIDVFSFTTISGTLDLRISTLPIENSRTRAGNLDIEAELLDSGGRTITSDNPPADTQARLQATVSAGTYYIQIRPTSAGSPTSNPPSGYTTYGTLGQYFISGQLAAETVPQAILIDTNSIGVTEGGIATIALRLAQPPALALSVTVSKISGDPDLLVTAGSAIVFTPLNWSVPVPVVLAALPDLDQQSGSATFTCSAPGVSDVTFTAREMDTTPNAVVSVTVNDPAWGTASPAGGSFSPGTTVQLLATPSPYYEFSHWIGDMDSTNNPLSIVLTGDLTVQAVFTELVTTNYVTPYAWLADQGVTADFENAESRIGANGIPYWQSYIAGLDPNDPSSRLIIEVFSKTSQNQLVLRWKTAGERVYTIETTTEPTRPFRAIPEAIRLPADTTTFTIDLNGQPASALFRLQVEKP